MRALISIALALFLTSGVSVMAEPKTFICTHEKDNLPSLDPLADAWYREAVLLAKPDTLRPWDRIVELYSKAVERDHWKAMHNLAALYRTGWPGGVEKDTQKAIDLYQRMIDLNIPQGFYNMGAMIGNRVGVKNPATDGLTFLEKAASMGNPVALTELGKQYIYIGNKDALGLKYTQCAADQGYGQAHYELGSYYEIVKRNFPIALNNYQKGLSLGHDSSARTMKNLFCKTTPPHEAMWYMPNDDSYEVYNDYYLKLLANPELKFPDLIKDHPLPPHPTQGYDADRPNWKPDQ